MIKLISNKFTSYLFERNIIKDEVEVYQYGFELILSYSIGCCLILIMSLFNDMLIPALIYLVTFFYMRKYTGGYHCKSYLSCNLSFISIYIVYSYLCMIMVTNLYTNIIYIFALFMIWFLAPCDHENKVLSEAEIKKYGRISRIMLVIYSVVMVLIFWISPQYAISMQLTLMIIAILLILGKIERRVEKHV